MKPRRDPTRLAGVLALGMPMLDVVLGGAFGLVHALVGSLGLALLVPTLIGEED
jgi:predicted lipid-binding transport protein (Tim44 family)